jgi:hypothetical protein
MPAACRRLAHTLVQFGAATAIAGYEATVPSETARRMQSCMVLRNTIL